MQRVLNKGRMRVRSVAGAQNWGAGKALVGGSRSYNFASSEYMACFGDLPVADGAKLRRDTIAYCDNFDPKVWYNDPVTCLLKNKVLTGGQIKPTVDAFNYENGNIRYGSEEEIDLIIAHMKAFVPVKDYREAVRKVEAEIFANHSDMLIGNQALDYRKQDGVTEIEESVQANLVERRLNDKLLADETAGAIKINRFPAYVGCVSNFTNFLDLSRKTLRNIELGVPVVILSRSNTTQHMYRWVTVLVGLLEKHGVDTGLVTYASAELEQQKRIFAACPEGALYITSSREVAAAARESHGNVLSSTGGPNTLVAHSMTPEISEAIQLSAMIENSGQCTALRHACIGNAVEDDFGPMFEGAPTVSSPSDALRTGAFAGVFDATHPGPFSLAAGYKTHPQFDNIALKFNGAALPEDGIEEHWRQTYVDMSAPTNFGSDGQVKDLADWLVRNQPISLAMNTINEDLGYARKLFEQTSQVVYTVGYEGEPALTCQARPQEGEIFGEFPVRKDLSKYTRYPVVIPSPTPAYNAHYEASFLESKAGTAPPAALSYATALLDRVQNAKVKGFCVTLMEYINDAAAVRRGDGKHTGGPDRTALFGLQRPPLNGQPTLLRCDANTTFDELAPTLLPFYVTNAADGARISVDPSNAALRAVLDGWADLGVVVDVQDEAAFAKACSEPVYNIVPASAMADNNNTDGDLEKFPLVQQFTSLYFPMGHIKSTRSDDETFVTFFSASEKWLKVRSL